MMVEFIGSTGAGKTTLISEVRRRLSQKTEVMTAFEFVVSPLRLHGINHPTARNLIQEFVGFFYVLGSLHRHKDFIAFVLRMLRRQANVSVYTLNNLRSLLRKIGVYEIIRRSQRGQVVLVDEGTVLLAHNLFVYSDAVYSCDEVERFASLVPLPDKIIYIKAPLDTLLQRTLKRNDRPREMRSKDQRRIEEYIQRATRIFDHLSATSTIQSRILIVENRDDKAAQERAVEDIIQFILDRK